jgi:hypothetical protein
VVSLWIESHQSLRDHPKKDQLTELLWDPMTPADLADFGTIGLLHCLWYWATDFAQDGDLSRFTDRQIAKGCRFAGDGAHLRAALKASGFLDADEVLHDWHEYAGKLIQKREQDRQRKAVPRSVRGSSKETPRKNPVTDLPTDKPLLTGEKNGAKSKEPARFDFKKAADALRNGSLSELIAEGTP